MAASDAPDELEQLHAELATVREQAATDQAEVRRDLAANLPRERVVLPAPETCPCCGSDDLSRLPADVTETLERVPARHKVIQTVWEKVSCRRCDKMSQPPAPFHATPRAMFGPHFLANLAFQKYGLHQPPQQPA